MTYHMQTKGVKLNTVVKIESQKLFPEKLFDVANDDYLFRWTDGGTWVSVVDDTTFEKEVMSRYPGFLQIPSFVNLRRLFREYGFEWRVNEETSQYEFYHPCFQKEKPELLVKLKSRRKFVNSTLYQSRKRSQRSKTSRPRTRLSAKDRRSHLTPVENNAQVQKHPPLAPIKESKPSSPNNSVQSPDTKGTPDSYSTPPISHSNGYKHKDTPAVVRKDYSDLRKTYWQNEYGTPTFHSGLPPEVWAQAPMPLCPTAMPVNPDAQNGHGFDPNYEQLKQMYPQPNEQPQPAKGSQVVKDQNAQQDNNPPVQWGWGPVPYFFPYNGEVYGGMPPHWTQGQGAGDSDDMAAENKMHPMIPPGMPPYWGYPMPWGFPSVPPYQDPNNSQTQSSVIKSNSGRQLNVDEKMLS